MSDPNRDNDRRGPITAGALGALAGALGLMFYANGQMPSQPVPTATTATTSTSATSVPTAADVTSGLAKCEAMTKGSAEQIACARSVVTGARSALVEGIAQGTAPADLASLWTAEASGMALGLGPDDDPSAVFPAGSLPAPAAGPSANTVTCTPAAGTRKNLGVPGTNNRPSALAVVRCQGAGAVALVALFRKSGSYYADGTQAQGCTGARCTVQAASNSRCGRYRSYVVAYDLNGKQEAGPISDTWSPEQHYCNPKAA
ncbi:MAG: hypothetical protein U0Y82_01200 [Thermoleophilia bacterium]